MVWRAYMARDPVKFIRFGDIHGLKPSKLIKFCDIHDPKPCKSIRFGDIHGFKPYKCNKVLWHPWPETLQIKTVWYAWPQTLQLNKVLWHTWPQNIWNSQNLVTGMAFRSIRAILVIRWKRVTIREQAEGGVSSCPIVSGVFAGFTHAARTAILQQQQIVDCSSTFG
jgi:hypothetical protein